MNPSWGLMMVALSSLASCAPRRALAPPTYQEPTLPAWEEPTAQPDPLDAIEAAGEWVEDPSSEDAEQEGDEEAASKPDVSQDGGVEGETPGSDSLGDDRKSGVEGASPKSGEPARPSTRSGDLPQNVTEPSF